MSMSMIMNMSMNISIYNLVLVTITIVIVYLLSIFLWKKPKPDIGKKYERPNYAPNKKSRLTQTKRSKPTNKPPSRNSDKITPTATNETTVGRRLTAPTTLQNILPSQQQKVHELWRKLRLRYTFWKTTTDGALSSSSSPRPTPSSHMNVQNPCDVVITSSTCIVGIDCEMVGVGRGGIESALARCSIVTFRNDDGDGDDGVTVLYDVYIKPTKRVTDYRTQWSGITPQHLGGNNVKSLKKCRMDVMELISSTVDGKMVIIVGHSLENDFEALNLRHPQKLVRDTATYPPFMRSVRRRMYPQKLSYLAKEHLDIDIQNNGSGNIKVVNAGDDGPCKEYQIGHSSVEDAAAALMLYRKVSHHWEASLGFPFRTMTSNSNSTQTIGRRSGQDSSSSITLYLDGSNLPMGLRRRKLGETTGDARFRYQLISKTQAHGNAQVRTPVEWIGSFHSLLSCSSSTYQGHDIPPITKIVIMFDGASFKSMPEEERPKARETLSTNLYLEVSDEGVEVDDVLIERCRTDLTRDNNSVKSPPITHRQMATVDEVITLLYQGAVDQTEKKDVYEELSLNSYAVVRRKGGGRKSHKKLFEKLNLRRPEEGAFCLLPSFICNSDRLRRNSLHIARELKRANVQQLVEYEIRQCRHVRGIVVTDDILLADRVVEAGAVVMSYRQLQQML